MSCYPVVHIWQQLMWHCNGYIIGNKEGLLKLKEAIDKAINSGKSEAETFASDGEGYNIKVICIEDEETEYLAVSYTDEVAQEKSEKAVYPWDM